MNRKSIKCHSKQKDSSIFVLLLTLLLIACGGDSGTASGGSTKLSNADMEVDSYSQLPSCVEKREGKTAYVVDQEQGYVCQEGEWVEDESIDVAYSSSSSKIESDFLAHYDCDVYNCVITKYLNSKMLAEGMYGELLDKRDNQVYRTVKIGKQVWLAQNLNYDYQEKSSTDMARSYCYDDRLENCSIYGRLYSLSAVSKKLCPDGWRVPSKTDFEILLSYVGGEYSAAIQKLKSNNGWDGTDDYGFSVIPAGDRHEDGVYGGLGHVFGLHSSTFDDEYETVFYWDDITGIGFDYSHGNDFGRSVRCVKD